MSRYEFTYPIMASAKKLRGQIIETEVASIDGIAEIYADDQDVKLDAILVTHYPQNERGSLQYKENGQLVKYEVFLIGELEEKIKDWLFKKHEGDMIQQLIDDGEMVQPRSNYQEHSTLNHAQQL